MRAMKEVKLSIMFGTGVELQLIQSYSHFSIMSSDRKFREALVANENILENLY